MTAAGRTTVGHAWSEALGEEITYRIHLPVSDTPLATAYLLHGRGEDRAAWTHITPCLDALVAAGAVPPVALVMPEAPWSDGGSWYVDSSFTGSPTGRPVETALTRDLVTHVDATYPTRRDRAHRVVGGCSMGGAGALRHLLARPDLFSGGLVLSPAVYDPLPPADSSAREFGAFGRGAERFDESVYAALGHRAGLAAHDPALPVRLFLTVGDEEWAHPRPEDARHDLDLETARVHNRAKRAAGVTSRLRVLGGGHDWGVWEPAFAEGLSWLLGPTGGEQP